MSKFSKKKKIVNIELTGFDAAKKLNIIKEVKSLLGLGLKEAKDLIEKLPTVLKSAVPTEEADTLKSKLEELGCQINLV